MAVVWFPTGSVVHPPTHLPTQPTGFHKDHANIELLKNRRFVAVKTFADDVRPRCVFVDACVQIHTHLRLDILHPLPPHTTQEVLADNFLDEV